MKLYIKVLLFTGIIPIVFFVWARFIEPQIILTNNTEINVGFQSEIVLVSDLHMGIYKDQKFLTRAVETINNKNPDYVMIGGDFTLVNDTKNLDMLFAPLSNIKAPVYAVLGNHDTEKPGPNIKNELKKVLEKNNVKILNNEEVILNNFTLIGLGDAWGEYDDASILKKYEQKDNVVVLTHNPDTTLKYDNKNADLTFAGHTHCGQIRIPIIYKFVIPTKGNFDKHFTEEENTKLFITCGLGESWPPMRLFNPPSIDVINLK